MAKAPARPRYGRRRERAPRRSGGGAGGDRWRWLSRTISLVDLDFRFARSGRKGKPPERQRARGKQRGETATGEHGSTPSPSRPLRREGARSCAHLEFVQERLLPVGCLDNRRARATRRVASSGGCSRALASAYWPLPCAIGGKSASLLMVFLPTCSPPLSRNIASATAITAPNMAPSVPFRALLSLIINSDPSN